MFYLKHVLYINISTIAKVSFVNTPLGSAHG